MTTTSDPSLTQTVSPESLQTLLNEATGQVSNATSLDALENVRLEFLGRKGQLTTISRSVKDLPPDLKPIIGKLANEISQKLEATLDAKKNELEAVHLTAQLQTEAIDVTMPGVQIPPGRLHPLTQTINEICDIFARMGFERLPDNACPEVETDYYNFEALNFPADHPARDMQDTFYTTIGQNVGPNLGSAENVGVLLRSQTSNAQIRHMEKNKPPVQVIAPGRVYRNEAVSSRKHVLFHQIEGLWVDEKTTFSDLKGTLHEFTRQLFAEGGKPVDRPTRFRPSFFPFTEPSAEVDVQCILCKGAGCRTCSHTGWLEILGCGMVHPNVLRGVGIDPERYQGFAFGMGVERLAMLKYAINDIRLFFNNDLRFLQQF